MKRPGEERKGGEGVKREEEKEGSEVERKRRKRRGK